jgi:hypothetical protein
MIDLVDVYFLLDSDCELVCAAQNYTLVRDCVQKKLIRLLGGRNYTAKKRKGVPDTYESITVGRATVRFESIDAGYTGNINYMFKD